MSSARADDPGQLEPPVDGVCAFPCFESFEDGDFDHATLSGLWHISSTCVQPWSGRKFLGFMDDSTCDYTEGVHQAGSASLWLDLSDTSSAFLRFMDVHHAEEVSFVDQSWIEVSRNGGMSWTALMSPKHSYSHSWRRFTFDLSAFAGEDEIIVRWRFDTVDEFFNRQIGWLIDDVVVDDAPACSANDSRADACRIDGARYQNHQFTIGLTDEAAEIPACGVGRSTAWYRYTHREPARVLTLDTIGSVYDVAIAVYDGPLMIACDDEVPIGQGRKGGEPARLSFVAMRNRTYDIQIGGHSGATGSVVLELR